MWNGSRWFMLGLLVVACGGSDPPGGSGGSAGTGAGTGGSAGTGGVAGSGGGGSCIPGETFNAGTDPNRNMVSASSVCQRLAEIQCAAERCCCPNGEPHKYDSLEACVASQRNICIGLETETVAIDARSGFSADAMTTAFAEFERLASSCDLGIVNWGTSQAGFAGVLTGSVSSGGTCWRPITDGQDAAAIASCGSVNACLGDGILTDPSWTCGARLGEGGRCLVDPSCREDLFCDPLPTASNTTLGTCQTRRAVGASCVRATQCQSLFCIAGQCAQPSTQAAYCLKP